MFEQLEWLVGEGGYLGIAALMFLENVFPPIPSELIMPLAGYVSSRGELDIAPTILAGTAGSVAGALLWYRVGQWVGLQRVRRLSARHGRWLTVSPRDLERANRWFERHAGMAVLLGRLVPTVRTLISVPAGIACMGLTRFLAYSTVGTVPFVAALAGAGYVLGEAFREVSAVMNPVSNVVVGLIVLSYVYRVLTFRADADADDA